MAIEILHRYTGAVLYSSATAQTIAEAVVEAVRNRASLNGASLDGASLNGASLNGAKTSEATKLDRVAITLVGSRHVLTAYRDRLWIGCHTRTYDDWLHNYERIGKIEGYSEEQIAEYGNLILSARSMFEMAGQKKRVEP